MSKNESQSFKDTENGEYQFVILTPEKLVNRP